MMQTQNFILYLRLDGRYIGTIYLILLNIHDGHDVITELY